ncbi:MAG: H(+)/Cl(-) exchange transporter ClcA [Methanonatronarchaeales archaeon]|nr:H(+)/Cl(-) exchange transporter ClcA [Methanonatronarchaeales archaeon]
MFALEVLLAEYYLRHVISVVLSAVMATAVARSLLQLTPNLGIRDFLVPVQYQMVTPIVELPLYMVLGVVVAIVGVLVVKVLYGMEHFFERLDVPGFTKPAIGGALLGGTILATSYITGESGHTSTTWLMGVGYDTVRSSISGELAIAIMVILAIMKVVGFSMTVGSGSSGGIFSPSLYIGAMAGGAFGVAVHALVPGTAPAGAYALVGIAGVFAAAASAPLTATLMIFELTGQYSIILPVLVVCVLGSEGSNHLLDRGTIYTEELRDKGITIQERRIGSLEDLVAKDVMTRDVDRLPEGTTLGDALEVFRKTGHKRVAGGGPGGEPRSHPLALRPPTGHKGQVLR